MRRILSALLLSAALLAYLGWYLHMSGSRVMQRLLDLLP